MEIQVRHRLRLLAAAILVLATVMPMQARSKKERADSLVRIMKAESLQLMEKGGQKYRKAVASTFLHNGTYLISDTALWNVDTKVINAWGHVKVIQDETILTSDKLDYFIDEDLAQFRGTLVQLQNKKKNQLRTRYLDYNTRDSLAVFRNGASMRDAKGQIIESLSGTYNSQTKIFNFEEDVNMFTDSIFVKTNRLLYFSELERAEFPTFIDFWKGGNMLSAGCGWYNRAEETFFFQRNVHGMSQDQEVWADTLYFYRVPNDVLLMGHAQVQDSSRKVAAMADRIYYTDSLSQVLLRRRAAVILETEHNSKCDTIYMGADTLIYRTIPKCDIPEGTVKACETRLTDIVTDAVTEFRRQAAKAAAEAAEKARQEMGGGPGKRLEKGGAKDAGQDAGQDAVQDAEQDAEPEPKPKDEPKPDPELDTPDAAVDSVPAIDTLALSRDSLALRDSLAVKDSLAAPLDSAVAAIDRLVGDMPAGDNPDVDDPGDMMDEDPVPDTPVVEVDSTLIRDSLAKVEAQRVLDSLKNRDTTRIGFIYGVRNVRIFREDIQVRCDSMAYCDLDSVARFYTDPIVWNDGNRQYTSDSLFILIGKSGPRKASLQSNAFVITEEDAVSYDQIKGAEIMAYFDTLNSTLKRFDALGGASAIFYVRENEAFATVNKVETKMLSAMLKDGNIDQVSYFESPKNNAYPVVQLPELERQMKGFKWRPDERPQSPQDVTTLVPRESERGFYLNKPRAKFKHTETYFPGYMPRIRREIAIRDSLAKLPRKPVDTSKTPPLQRDSIAMRDSLALRDSLSAPDSLKMTPDSTVALRDSLAVLDSLANPLSPAPQDSLSKQDSLKVKEEVDPLAVPTVDPKQKKKEERELKRQLRIAARNARIAKREARWAELDRLDSLKIEAKKQKALDKQREKTLRTIRAIQKQDAKDAAKLQKFIEKYKKQYEREQKRDASRKRTQAPEAGGEVPAPAESGEPPVGGNAVLGEPGSVDDDPVLGGGGVPGT